MDKKKMRKKGTQWAKRLLAAVCAAALVLGLMPGDLGTISVQAEESKSYTVDEIEKADGGYVTLRPGDTITGITRQKGPASGISRIIILTYNGAIDYGVITGEKEDAYYGDLAGFSDSSEIVDQNATAEKPMTYIVKESYHHTYNSKEVIVQSPSNTWGCCLRKQNSMRFLYIYVMEPQPVETISSVDVTGIDTPTAGTALDTTAACATKGVSTTEPTVTWKAGEAEASGNAAYSTAYTASVTLEADSGYKFTDSTTATVNGNTATSVAKNDDGTLTVTYTFAETSALDSEKQIAASDLVVGNKYKAGMQIVDTLGRGVAFTGYEDFQTNGVAGNNLYVLCAYFTDSNKTLPTSGSYTSRQSPMGPYNEPTEVEADEWIYGGIGGGLGYIFYAPKYTINLTNASSDVSLCYVRTSVTITADAAPEGKEFSGWTGLDGITITSGSASTETVIFTMPAKDVSITANYKDEGAAPTIFVDGQPKNASVKSGETAEFTVTATGDDLTYQWQIDRNDGKGFVNIDGATAASYRASAVDVSDSGFKYHCIVTNTAGSVTSNVAILTVTADEPEPHTHTLVYHAEVAATTIKAGTKAYWQCSDCKKYFSDAEGKTEIEKPEIIPIIAAKDDGSDKGSDNGSDGKDATTTTTTTETATTETAASSSPKTGDGTPIAWLFALMLVCGCGTYMMIEYRKSGRKNQ